jgi:GNAT superfamily N-acetyltransferase
VEDIIVRLATEADVPGLLPLIRLVSAAMGETLPPEADVAAIVRRQIADEHHEYVIAEMEGHILGYVFVCYYLATWAGAPCAMFQDFIVEEGWRGRGVGSTILAYARNRARIKGCAYVDLIVPSALEGARRFFRRWDFRPTDREIMRLKIARPNPT